jgi:hypothetical protein
MFWHSDLMICEHAEKVDIRSYGQHPPRGRLFHRGRPIAITSTPCTFGGCRYWFLCPGCGRRCAILYPTLCRTCRRGRYLLETLSPENRRILKAHRLRRRLGQRKGGLEKPMPPKPHLMRWHTYLRLRRELQALEKQIARDAVRAFPSIGPLPDGD